MNPFTIFYAAITVISFFLTIAMSWFGFQIFMVPLFYIFLGLTLLAFSVLKEKQRPSIPLELKLLESFVLTIVCLIYGTISLFVANFAIALLPLVGTLLFAFASLGYFLKRRKSASRSHRNQSSQ